jgi:hypothetical protein
MLETHHQESLHNRWCTAHAAMFSESGTANLMSVIRLEYIICLALIPATFGVTNKTPREIPLIDYWQPCVNRNSAPLGSHSFFVNQIFNHTICIRWYTKPIMRVRGAVNKVDNAYN